MGIEPTAATLARRARCLSCHPQVPAGWQPAGLALGAHAVELTITGHVHPAGWCSQGRKDLNLHQRGWSPLLRCRYATPLCNRKPPLPGLSGGRLLVAVLRCYPEASQSARPLPRAGISCGNGDAAACRSRLTTGQDCTGLPFVTVNSNCKWEQRQPQRYSQRVTSGSFTSAGRPYSPRRRRRGPVTTRTGLRGAWP